MLFSELNLDPKLGEALEAMGFKEATPIQEMAIPLILDKKDVIACAQTGTGKTAAFLLPILNKLASKSESEKGKINTLVIAPTRELALQIDQQVEAFGYFLGVSSLSVYGGGSSSSWDQQKKALKGGADIIIATPGRLIAHLKLGYVNLGHLEHFILDEADRMLDMGFLEDIMEIVSTTPATRQTLLFSATMPSKIRHLSNKVLKNPTSISIAISKPAAGVLQAAYMVYDRQKIALIQHLLTGQKAYPSVLIFSSTKRMVKEIARGLNSKKNLNALEISSDLDQKEREFALMQFRNKKIQILVATDILARGIDIKEISLVINYDVPNDAEDYVHRIGRTARADSTGVALTFISDNYKDQYRFHQIESLIEMEIKKLQPPADIGEGPKYSPNIRRGSKSGGGGGGGYKKKRSFNKNKSNKDRRGGNSGNNSSKPNNNRTGDFKKKRNPPTDNKR